MRSQPLRCRCHRVEYTKCPSCTHLYCAIYWKLCPRCHGVRALRAARPKWYQQCWSDRDSKTGSFLYDPTTGIQWSPTFEDSVQFLAWLKAEGWTATSPGELQTTYQYTKEPALR